MPILSILIPDQSEELINIGDKSSMTESLVKEQESAVKDLTATVEWLKKENTGIKHHILPNGIFFFFNFDINSKIE